LRLSLLSIVSLASFRFFLHHPPPTEIYTLSLHDALPISRRRSAPSHQPDSMRSGPARISGTSSFRGSGSASSQPGRLPSCAGGMPAPSVSRRQAHSGLWSATATRSEEHTSALQSRENLVC